MRKNTRKRLLASALTILILWLAIVPAFANEIGISGSDIRIGEISMGSSYSHINENYITQNAVFQNEHEEYYEEGEEYKTKYDQ